MKKIFLPLIISFFCISMIAQEKRTFTESINYYLTINGTEKQYSSAIDQLFVMLKQQYADKNVDAAVWSALESEEEKELALNQIKVMLASAYRSHFESDDLEGMIEFYESPAGKQLLVDPTAMSQEQKDKMTIFYGTPAGIKLNEQKQSLAEMISQISESWSSRLYLSTKEKLATKGYDL